MVLLYADGFEDGTTPWTLSGTALGTGRNGNGIVSSATSGRSELGLVPTAGPIIVGCAVKTTGQLNVIVLSNTGGSTHVILQRGAAGEINVCRTNTSTILGSSAAGVVPTGAWCYVEVKAVIHDTTGSVVVRVNGVQVLNLTNVDTKDSSNATTNQLSLGLVGGGTTGSVWDDVYVADTTGSVNNDFLGDVVVEHLRPTADDTAQWLGSDGNSVNNYDLVDEAGTFNGADYVASATVGQRDLYTSTASVKPITAPVAGVVAVAVAMKTDSGTRSVKLDIKEGAGGTVRSSADLALPTTFGEIRAVFDRKADGSAWTVADVNALRMGYEVST